MIMKRQIGIVALTLMLIAVVVAIVINGCKKTNPEDPPLGLSESLRFVFLADSRGDSLGDMIDTTALNPIIRQIGKLNPAPSFVVFGGDMCYRGYMDKKYTFQTFENLFSELTGRGIKLYTLVGNHELYHEHASYGYFLVNQEHFQSTFSENPANGPTGYEHLAYSFTEPRTNSFFAVLDPYFVDEDTMHLAMGGTIDSTQMAWLTTQVSNSTAIHKFLFIHPPYYYVTNDPEEPSSADTTYTKLWAFLDANKFDFVACGHQHLYSRKTIDSSVPADPKTTPPTPVWQNNVVQLLNGTCGAGPSSGYIDPTLKTFWNIHNDANTFYFSVVDVSGKTTKVKSYGGNLGSYAVIDSLTITK